MSYAGNAKLSQEIQNRILNTFQQTIALVEEGNVQEALLGCDFILRLDPLFEPARKLQGRLQESGTDVTVEDLAAFAASPLDTELPPLGEGTEEDADLAASDVETEVEDFTLPDLDVESVTPPVDDLASTFAELFAQREFGQILELAAQNQESLEAIPICGTLRSPPKLASRPNRTFAAFSTRAARPTMKVTLTRLSPSWAKLGSWIPRIRRSWHWKPN